MAKSNIEWTDETWVGALAFESSRLLLPTPREYERKREYGKAGGTGKARRVARIGGAK